MALPDEASCHICNQSNQLVMYLNSRMQHACMEIRGILTAFKSKDLLIKQCITTKAVMPASHLLPSATLQMIAVMNLHPTSGSAPESSRKFNTLGSLLLLRCVSVLNSKDPLSLNEEQLVRRALLSR